MLELDDILSIHRASTLRWNRQFSLISRVNPEQEIEALLSEARDTFRQLEAALEARPDALYPETGTTIRYYDLGSGGGFPGLVWNHLFSVSRVSRNGYQGGHLVEPREKRAWFLEQCARKQEQENLTVHRARWGADGLSIPPGEAPTLHIISLKALRLDNDDIATGLVRALGGARPQDRLLICRFISHLT